MHRLKVPQGAVSSRGSSERTARRCQQVRSRRRAPSSSRLCPRDLRTQPGHQWFENRERCRDGQPSSTLTGFCDAKPQDKKGHRDPVVDMGRTGRTRPARRPHPSRGRSARPPLPRPGHRRPRARAPSRRCRSLSLTRSSFTPRITVTPSAQAATTERIGYSSIIDARPLLRHFDALKLRCPHAQVCHRLAALFARVLELDIGAHLHKRCVKPVSRRVLADAGHEYIRPRDDQRRADRERCRGRITRHSHRLRPAAPAGRSG